MEIIMDSLTKFITPGIIFLLTLAFGFWLSHSGKPYNSILFNIHKLIALATVVLTVIQLVKVLKVTQIQALFMVAMIVAGLCVVALFVSGALLSAGKLSYDVMLTIHRIAPILLTISLGLMVYILTRNKV
jgi:hypothetical protein